MISQLPAYNLMVVLKETGLKADVLRAWERRYQLPSPQRTPGGHRLYSEYDIAIVKWLKGRQTEGLSISRAVKLWKDLIAAGLDPLKETAPASTPLTLALVPVAGKNIDALRQEWLDACLAFNAIKAEEALSQAFAIVPVEQACIAILQQGLKIIGEQWYLGRVSPQQEHFASAMATRRLETLITAAPQPTRNKIVLVGCPLGEMHAFPSLLLSLFLQRMGLKIVYLGADIPLEQLDHAVDAIRPDLVVLAAQQLVTAASLVSTALALRDRGIPLGYGGLVFNRLPELRQRIPATFLGESLEEAKDKIEQLLNFPASLPPAISPDENFQKLAGQFRQVRPLIEVTLTEKLRNNGLQIEKIETVNSFFSSKLTAALDLGNLALLEGELDWIKGLLTHQWIPMDQLLAYLVSYSQCIRAEMRQDGSPISDWIDQYVIQNTQPQ
jgi:DNA-binding transcriptional MerR regulator